MLSSLARLSRFDARVLPKPLIDLRQFLHVGDKAEVRKHITKLQTVNRTALPGDEVISTARLMQQVELLTASMIEANLDKHHQSAGFYIDLDHAKAAYLGSECTFTAEVTEVTDKKATFKAKIVDSRTGDVIGTGTHSRVILYCEDAIKIN